MNESKKKIVLTGTINGQEYTNTLQLGKWDGNTSAAQIVECAKLFFEVYPPMYERFHGISNPTNTLTLAVENEDYGVAYASGSFVHIHDQWLASNPIDYDCLTHEFAHVIQNGWDGNYCEVSDYIEHFANVRRYIYAIGGGKYNDAGGWNLAPGSSC